MTYRPAELTELNLADAGVSTVIWATGYPSTTAGSTRRSSTSWATRGTSAASPPSPGFFLGLLWQHSQASASLVGPELDGPDLVEAMAGHARRPRAQTRSRISA